MHWQTFAAERTAQATETYITLPDGNILQRLHIQNKEKGVECALTLLKAQYLQDRGIVGNVLNPIHG